MPAPLARRALRHDAGGGRPARGDHARPASGRAALSDAELRALEQAWRASGLAADERAYLHALRRAGRLDLEAIEVATYLGDDVAGELLEGGLDLAAPEEPRIDWFLERLPGGGAVQFRAALAVTRAVLAACNHRPEPFAVACLAAAEACEAEGAGARELLAARSAADAHEAILARSPRFIPAQPLLTYVFAVPAEEALDRACWVLARYAGGLERDEELCATVGALIRQAALGDETESALRAAVRAALHPWVLLRERALGAPPSVEELLLGDHAMTPSEARAVIGLGVPASTEQARAVLEGFLVARGYIEVSGPTFVDMNLERAVKLLKRTVRVSSGGPGRWRRLPGTEGHELLLTTAAEFLVERAETTLRAAPEDRS